MRTLKKTLALVLVLAMMFSLCAVSASADFSDAEEIKYVEAAEVLAALGVIEGMPDGSFDPNGTLTRAQAATIIVRLLKAEDLAKASEATFTDVAANHWAADAIGYCAEQGIIDGYGDGTYGPSDALKGYQWAKMLLVAAGYDADEYELTGTAWQINTAKLANKVGLFAGNLKGDKTVAATREEACLYALNAATLGTTTRYYYVVDKGTTLATMTEDDIHGTYTNPTDAYVLAEIMGTAVAEVLVKDVTTGSMLDAFKVSRDATTAVDAFGRPGVRYERAKINGYLNMFYADEAAATTLVTGVANDTLAEIAKAAGLKVTTDASYVKGETVELYADDKGNVTKVVVLDPVLAKITKVAAADADAEFDYTVTMSVAGSLKVYNDTALIGFDAETMVKDTYVIVDEGTGFATIAVAEKVTGNMTAQGTGYVKVDGEKYEYSGNVWGTASSYLDVYDFYLDANGYVAGVAVAEKAEEATNVFYVKATDFAAAANFTAQKAKLAVVNLDGSEEIVDMAISKTGKVTVGGTEIALNLVNDTEDSGDDTIPAGFYQYTLTEDGDVKAIKAVGYDTKFPTGSVKGYAYLYEGHKVTFTEGKAKITWWGDTFYADANTTLTTIKTGLPTVTIKGYENFPSKAFTASADVHVLGQFDKTGALVAVYVIGDMATPIADDAIYGWYVSTGDTYKTALGADRTDVVYNVAGEDKTFTVAATSIAADYKALTKIVVTDGIAELEAVTGTVNKAVTAVSDTYLLVKGSADPIYFADKVAYYDVTNVAKNGVVADDAVVKGDIISYLTNTKGEIVAVYTAAAAQEDGVITLGKGAADLAYFGDVLNLNPAALSGLADDASYAVVQYTRPATYTTAQFKFVGEETAEVTYDLTAGYAPVYGRGVLVEGVAADTYTYQILFDGVVTQTGTFVIE